MGFLIRYGVVALLLGLDALAIYLGGSEVGFSSTLITVILIGFWLAFSFARDGLWSERRRDTDETGTGEGDRMVHRSRARPP
jgi:hypothetical protein